MKQVIGWLALVACLVSTFMAIWVPVGSRGQWIAMVVVLLLVGAGILGSIEKQDARREVTPLRDGEVLSGTGDEELDRKLNSRPTHGKRSE